ncbi:MAG: chemotaxis protein CheW [Cyanobacteria bacterium P01_D01_bin.115]
MSHDCWNQIGVRGDRTCPTLETVIHCQNCPVYSQAGRGLLDRPAPDDYLAEWTTRLARDHSQQAEETLSVALFRLGAEWLALPGDVLRQVLPPSPVHSLPHRRDRVLRGLVNVRGQLLLCVALSDLLGLAATPGGAADSLPPGSYARLVVMARGDETWAFEADEFYGLYRCPMPDVHAAPTHASRILATLTQNILHWRDQHVSYLNRDRLFDTLQQQTL